MTHLDRRLKLKITLCSAVLVVLITACGGGSDLPSPDAAFVFNNLGEEINTVDGTRHIWSGFTLQQDFYVSNKSISKLILWHHKAGETELTLNYLLKPRNAEVFINSNSVFKLRPKYQLASVQQKVTVLKGFNLIEFRTKAKSRLKIKSLHLGGKQETPTHHIEGDKTVLRYYDAGSGSIALKGSGKLQIRQVAFINGEKHVEETQGGGGMFNIIFSSPGFIELRALSGAFDLIGHQYKETPEKPLPLSPLKKGEKPHVFIFLIDGCHAAHLSMNGYHRNTSPNIDTFAQDAVTFDNAYANATFTRSSVASIFTGFYPHRHKLRILTNRLPSGLFMLPEFMKKQGYKTALLTEAGNISRFFGFDQGVDNYQKIFRHWNDPRYLENNIIKFFDTWVNEESAAGPLFTYVHFRAPHFPIIPPPPFLDMYKEKKLGLDADRKIFHIETLGKGGYKYTAEEVKDITDDYDSTINYVDHQVGRMIATLKQKGLYDDAYIIFTSDHGEALNEHGYMGHGHNVYDETSRVPLVVKFPKAENLKGIHIKRLVQLVDIFPTIAGLFGEQRYFDGRSLAESVKIAKEDDLFVYSTSFGSPPAVSIRWRQWYYIYNMYNNSEELFHLQQSPLKSIAADNADMASFFRAKFLSWLIRFDNIERTSQSVDLKKLPKDEYDNLKSLGYIN